MKIVVAASDEQWNELTEHRRQILIGKGWIMQAVFSEYANADAFFNLNNNEISAGI